MECINNDIAQLKESVQQRLESPNGMFRIGNPDTGLIQIGYNEARAQGDSDVVAWAKGYCLFFEESEIELQAHEIFGCYFNNQSYANMIGIHKKDGAISGHFSVDYQLMLKLGIPGTFEYLKEWQDRNLSSSNQNPDPRSEDFYKACNIVWAGFQHFINRYEKAAADRLNSSEIPVQDRKWFEKIYQTMRNLQIKPPHDLYEAITLISLYHMVMQLTVGCSSFGQPDRFLYPYYLQSLNDGSSRLDIKTLIAAWFIKLNEFMSVPEGFMIGGQNAEGECMANDLTLIMLEVAGEINMTNPAMSFAWNPKVPKKFMDQIILNYSHGVMHPMLFNDLTIIPGFERIGVAHNDAVNYVNCTCTEPTTTGCSNIFVVTEYLNPNRDLLRVIHGGNFETLHGALNSRNSQELSYNPTVVPEFSSYEEFFEAFLEELSIEIDKKLKDQIRHEQTRIDTFAQPLISIFMHDCVEKGLDMAWGGGRYNFAYPQLVGFSTLIDSLYAIKELVYTKKEITLEQLGKILAHNWHGHEKLRQTIINKIPKWGNDNVLIDDLGKKVSEAYAQIVERYNGIFNHSTMHPGYLNFVMHGEFGKELGATPDGRLQKIALSNSFAPAQGVGKEGLTAMCNSASKIDQKRAIGSCTMNITLLQSTLNRPEQRDKFSLLIQTYFSQGGTQVQVNIFDPAMLYDAQIHPENYPNLVVKVGGFSARFIDLEKIIQDEIINRNGFTMQNC